METITILWGEKKLDPVTYHYEDAGDGTGWLVSSVGTRFGGIPHADLFDCAATAGLKFAMPSGLSRPKRWWRFWR